SAVLFRPEFEHTPVQQLFETPDSLICIIASYGPILYSEKTGQLYNVGTELPNGVLIVHAASDNNKKVWLCASDSTLVEVTGGHCGRRIHIPVGRAYSLMQDHEGDYWAGAYTGIIRISGLLSDS